MFKMPENGGIDGSGKGCSACEGILKVEPPGLDDGLGKRM